MLDTALLVAIVGLGVVEVAFIVLIWRQGRKIG